MRVGPDNTVGVALTAILLVAAACNCDASKSDESEHADADERTRTDATQANPVPAWGRALSGSGPKEAELLRDPSHPGLQRALQGDAADRSRAVWSLARIGGEAARETLQRIALSPSSDSTELAALSFLEPPRTEPSVAPDPEGPWGDLEDAVWSRYAVSEELAEAEALLLAAARLGGPASQQRLAADTEVAPSLSDVPRYRAAFEAMGILCARGHGLSRPGLRSIGTGLQAGGDAAAAAAYALGRCAGPSAEQLAGEERAALVRLLEQLLTASDDAARHGWRALAALGEIPESVPVAILHPSERPAWTTEVEAVRALGGHADGRGLLVDRLVAIAPASIEGTRVHVALESLRALRDGVVGTPELVHRMGPWIASLEAATAAATGRSAKALALVRCEARLLQAISSAALEPLRTCAIGIEGLPSTYGESMSVEALLRIGDAMPSEERVTALLKLAADPRPPVAAPALSALADVDHARVNPTLVEALGRDDAGVRAAAAGSIAARAVDGVRRDPEALPALVRLAGVDDPALFEARLAAIEALGSLARSSPEGSPTPWLESVVLPLHESPHVAVRRAARDALLGAPELLAQFDEHEGPPAKGPFDARVHEAVQAFDEDAAVGLRVRTDAGAFTIAFDHAPARVAQAVLTSLTRQKYFEELTFHRVVPAFVIQGGDPRGDGYGGPGFVMPCERSNVRYERGTVGMALAGKDTGGSQFFVTHTPQPHLDARYPVIGFVSEADLAVVDAILPHDRILEMTVLPTESAG